MSDIIPVSAPILFLICVIAQRKIMRSMAENERVSDARFLKYSSAVSLLLAMVTAIVKIFGNLRG